MSSWNPRARLAALMVGVGAFVLVAGCKVEVDSPTDPQEEPRPELSIPVEIDGREIAPIDGPMLHDVAPDYVSGEQRAWRFQTLLGPDLDRPDTVLEVESGKGFKTQFRNPAQLRDGRLPVLTLNRKGDALIALVSPDDPFPAYHGRGGNRGHGGAEPDDRIRDVKRLRLYREPAAKLRPKPDDSRHRGPGRRPHRDRPERHGGREKGGERERRRPPDITPHPVEGNRKLEERTARSPDADEIGGGDDGPQLEDLDDGESDLPAPADQGEEE